MGARTWAGAAIAACLTLTATARAEGGDDDAVCALGSSAGVDPIDAQTAAELVCDEVIASAPPPGVRYRVRLARIERRVVLGLTFAGQERHLVLTTLDEVPTAAPRLVASLKEDKPVAETQTTDNLVAAEARKPVRKPGDVHAWLGVTAVSMVNRGMETRGGAEIGMSFGSSTTAFVLDFRLVGESLMEPLTVAAEIVTLGQVNDPNRQRVPGAMGTGSIGVRQYVSTADTAPYGGVGFGLAYLSSPSDAGPHVSGSGVMPYAEIGLDVLRTHAMGGLVGLRLDVPTFSLEGADTVAADPGKNAVRHATVFPIYLSFNAAVRF